MTFTLFPVLTAVVILLLTACAADPSVVATSVAATLAAIPTTTPIVAVVEITVAPEALPSATPAPVTPSNAAPDLTSTPTSKPTPAPENDGPRAGLGEPNIHEEFNSAANWSPFDDNFSSVVIGDGELDFTVKWPGRYAWAIAGLQEVNFYAEVRTHVDECVRGDHYGFLFRTQPSNDPDGYFFTISCEGRYQLRKRQSGQFSPLMDWKERPAIHQGPQAANLLGVRAEGSHLILFANDDLLADLEAPDYSGGGFGLFVESLWTTNLLVRFDDLKIWNLP